MSEPRFLGATPVWWQSQTEVSVCIALGEQAHAALATLESVAASEGPLPEVLMLAPNAASPSAEAVLDWLLGHLWLPALVLAGTGGADALRPRARAGRVLTLSAGEVSGQEAVSKRGSLPLPPTELAFRVGSQAGDPWENYELIGRECRRAIEESLPADWAWEGRRALDFGCGAGRVLRQFGAEAERGAELHGCDIHEPSIRWMQEHLPLFSTFVAGEQPPLPRPDASFDLVWAMSVFTHLDDESWSGWLLDLHRLLKPGGILIATFLGEAMQPSLGEPWDDDHIGMNTLHAGQVWDRGGPMVFLSEWWIRAHWGRAFHVLSFQPQALGHGMVVMRRRDVSLTREDLERPEPGEPRELSAARHHARQLYAEAAEQRGVAERLTTQLREIQAAYDDVARRHAIVTGGRTWRFSAPLRWAARVARRVR